MSINDGERKLKEGFYRTKTKQGGSRKSAGHPECGDRAAHVEGSEIMKDIKQKLKAHLQKKFTRIYEGTSDSQSRLEQVFTKLYITRQPHQDGCISHEVLHHFRIPHEQSPHAEMDYQLSSSLDVFKPQRNRFQQHPTENKTIRRVMTKGIAGIGKTLTVQNFSLKWAQGKLHQHIDLIFVLPFRELNLLREGAYSLLQLLLHFYPELKALKDAKQLNSAELLLIFDGLDESRFQLDFEGSISVSDMNQRSTVDVLLISLIKGNLLPHALLWITSRPAAAGQIPSEYIDQVTEVQGFTDKERESYFRVRFSPAEDVLSRLSGMISFYFMGHIPIFCWIIAEVFRKGWSDEKSRSITTMTELYVHYLRIQTQRSEQKYGTRKKGRKMPKSQKDALLLNLSRLAWEQLQRGNIIFYEEDLRECGIDADEASVFCGFCSEILKQERGLHQRKMFSFVHLSFQEFLAALYLRRCCEAKNVGTLKSFLGADPADLSLPELQKKVVDKALQSENGQLDLFLCFFLGLSLESNQAMLRGFLPPATSSSDTAEEMKAYLRHFHAGNIPAERCMNLFLCKFELKEERFQDDISRYLSSGARLSTIDCSVLSTLLQISGEVIQELDLTKCFLPAFGTEKLLLLIGNCRKAALRSIHLSSHLEILLSTLQSADSCLKDLCLVSDDGYDLRYELFFLLGSSGCKLETLRLSGFSLAFQNCHNLASILQSKQSQLTALSLTSCIYGYQKDQSGYFSKEETGEYDEFMDELSLLTVIPSGLIGPICKLKDFSMTGCHLRSKCCQVFASALSSNTQLRKLDLSRNELQDLGVQLLSVGLGSSKCRLETLSLSCCGITEEGCASLASALKSNPSHLRELDLSYNHPGECGVKLLSERLEDPKCRLEKLNVEQNEEHWVNPQLLNKYACDLTFDRDSVNNYLVLSECSREVSHSTEEQPYPAHPDRFDQSHQVLCREALTARCYWEVEWTGLVRIAVAYKSLKRKGWDSEIGSSDDSWGFDNFSSDGYCFQHGNLRTFVPVPFIDVKAFLSRPKRVGLFVDWQAGVLCFYSLAADRKTLIYAVRSTFTEPLYPAFLVGCGSLTLSTVAKLNMDATRSNFTPEVSRERIGLSYSFRFPGSGLFQCSLTGLVFTATREGEVTYKTLIWDDKLLHPAQKLAGGPLFGIECPQDSISQLHLPHCEPDPALVSESLSVVHITDDGVSIIQPLEVTETHVVVDVPHLSAFGIVWDVVKRFKDFVTKPIYGQTLLFLRHMRSLRSILSVILLPSNVPLRDVKAQHTDSEFIQAPSFCRFHMGQTYSLHSDPGGFTIQPKEAEFFLNYGPNYHATFEIILPPGTEEVTVMIKDPEKTHVWEYSLQLSVPPSAADPGESRLRREKSTSADEKLRIIRPQFINQVSRPVLDKLLDVLQHCRVITDAEAEDAKEKPRADKARDLIDTVRKKGAEASSKMIAAFADDDPYLCDEFGLI